MAAKDRFPASQQQAEWRQKAAERRAAQAAALQTQQADLKREAAERRAKREAAAADAPPDGRR